MDIMGTERHYLTLIFGINKLARGGGWVQPQRGVRQGCPLAPLLFVLAVDVLATCTIQACSQGILKGFQTHCYPEGIQLLQYADDTTFFMEGSVEAARNLSTILDLFAHFSGLLISRAKSAFVGFGLTQEESLQCSKALGTPIGTLPMRY